MSVPIGKPKLGKDYSMHDRVWHFYQEHRDPDYTWSRRACDGAAVCLVYFSKGRSVRVCKACLKKRFAFKEWTGGEFYDGGSGRTRGKVWRCGDEPTPFPVYEVEVP